jgi:hypothetical protein
MGITFKSFSKCVGHVTAIRKPILLRARHGVGKSSVVYAYAEHIGMPVIERRASQMTEGDLLGLPKLDDGCTRWLAPDWLKTACEQPVALFIDEIDRATPEVRQGFFELTDSRKIAGSCLHDDTLIFAAVNGGEHAAQYQVGEMDPAELDRWTVFDIEPDVEDWLNWAKGKIDKTILDFIRQMPNHLEHSDDFEPNKVYPSRRSWHRLSDCLTQADVIEPGKTNPVLFNLTNAFVGQEAAYAFQDFVRQYERLLTVEDILDKGLWEETKNIGINEQTALVEKFEAAKVFEQVLTAKQIENVSNWFLVMPSEVAMKLWRLIGDGVLQNVLRIHEQGEVAEQILKIVKGEDN